MSKPTQLDWNLVAGRKQGYKRKNHSPNENKTVKRSFLMPMDYWLSTPATTSNSFVPLDTEEATETAVNVKAIESAQNIELEKNNDSQQHTAKPTPIFVSGVENLSPLRNMLEMTAAKNYTLKTLAGKQVKIFLNNPETYVRVVEELKKNKEQFYTYQSKSDKGYKVVLKGIHPSVDLKELQAEIETHGHSIMHISNIEQAVTKIPLPLFFLEMKVQSNNKEIFNINKLQNTIVSVEPPRKKRDIPQCMNCQDYCHTRKYCNKSPVCVKYAQQHATKDSPFTGKIKNVTCANCKGNHPASYKGCSVRKQLLRKLFPALRAKNQERLINSPHTQYQDRNLRKSNVSYSQAVAGTAASKQEDTPQYGSHEMINNNGSDRNDQSALVINKLGNMME
ncbi:hypothetical protein TKK_0009847 [Trichogramma kaykai]